MDGDQDSIGLMEDMEDNSDCDSSFRKDMPSCQTIEKASSNWSKVTHSLIPLEDVIQKIVEAMPFKSTAHCTENVKHIFP